MTNSSVKNSARVLMTENSPPQAIKINKKCRLDDRIAASVFIE